MAKILVVDDDAMNLTMAEFILKKQGHEVTKATSGQGCLDILAGERPDLVLMDIEMPQMSGIQAVELIRANAGLADLPVMFLTGTVDATIENEAVRLNVADVIAKPFIPGVFLEKVAKVVG